jgi:cold shock CspA family protein
MPIGKLRRYRDDGGFGFIEADDGTDTFVHASKLRYGGVDFPRDGMRLEFDVKKKSGEKPFATNIRLIEDE